ncbi:MAG: hypothetical protein WD231_02705 [Candidatus Woykebacteria bacterium]
MHSAQEVMVGRVEAQDFELLTKAILTYWKPPEIDWKKIALSQSNSVKGQSGMGFEYYY